MASAAWPLAGLLVVTLVCLSTAQNSTIAPSTVSTQTSTESPTSLAPSTTLSPTTQSSTVMPTTTTGPVTTASPASTVSPKPSPTVSTVLRHLNIVFRHGDRAPLAPLFPSDPFNQSADWPHGLDQLTTSGRARMFRLGQMIRAKYGDYLGDDYSPREIYARSSAIDRSLESAQLVLAGKIIVWL